MKAFCFFSILFFALASCISAQGYTEILARVQGPEIQVMDDTVLTFVAQYPPEQKIQAIRMQPISDLGFEISVINCHGISLFDILTTLQKADGMLYSYIPKAGGKVVSIVEADFDFERAQWLIPALITADYWPYFAYPADR